MKRKLDENDVPKPVDGQTASASTFDHLGLDARLLQAVAKEGFHKPTPIQAQAIPLVLQGKDVVGEHETSLVELFLWTNQCSSCIHWLWKDSGVYSASTADNPPAPTGKLVERSMLSNSS